MVKISNIQFQPDYAVHPGETLAETLQKSGMSQSELTKRTGLTRKTINGIIKGREPITTDTALQLERVFRIPSRFWINLQKNYEEATARIKEEENLQRYVDWMNEEGIPVRLLIKRGVIPDVRGRMERLKAVLTFFGVATPEEHRKVWERTREIYSFRKSRAHNAKFGAVSAWLRLGELAASEVRCRPFHKDKFEESLGALRQLSRKSIVQSQDKLKKILSECGIALVFEPGLRGAPVHGATRWLTKDKALVQMSVRGKNDGDFWFTLFHELGHIKLHGKRDVFLELKNGEDTDKEEEANRFARDVLIDPTIYRDFIRNLGGQIERPSQLPISRKNIHDFVRKVKIAPGIVVGRLQHDGWLPYSHCNDLKQKLRFKENNED